MTSAVKKAPWGTVSVIMRECICVCWQIDRLGFPFQTLDPFLFAVYHLDVYPPGNAQMGLDRHHLAGRQVGSDFSGVNGINKVVNDIDPSHKATALPFFGAWLVH